MKKLLPFLIGSIALLISSVANAQWTTITNTPGSTVNYGTTTVTVTGSNAATGGGCGGYYWTPGTNSSYTFAFGTAVPAVRFTCDALNYGESISFFVNGTLTPMNSCNLDPNPFVNSCSNGNCNIVGNTFVHNIVGQWTCGGVITFYGSITSLMVVQTVGGSGTTYDVEFADPGSNITGPGGTLVAGSNNPSCGQTLNLTASGMTGVTSYSWTGPNGFTSNVQNPSISNPSPVNAGVYTVTAQTACGPVTAQVTVTISVPNAPTVNSPVNYCQGDPSAALSATGQNLLWYTTQTGGTGSSIAPIPSTSTPGTFTWWVSQTVGGCESARTPIVVNVIAIPAVPTIGSNSPVCAGQTLNLTSNIYVGGTYTWTGPGFASAFQNPSIGNAQPGNTGQYCLTVNVGGCVSQPACINVTVNPLPTLSGASAQNPTTCGGTNGQITLNGLTPGGTYTINFTKNGVPQTALTLTANNLGQIVITGLGAGIYANIIASVSGCNSNSLGPITLTGPTPPNINVSVIAANNCNNPNGSMTISGLNNGTYTVNYSFNGTPITPLTLTASGGTIVISNLAPGVYSNITVTTSTTNCTSNIAGPITIGGPIAPVITLTTTSPTTCGGSNGSIIISGVTSGSTYTVNFSTNGNPQPPQTLTATNGTVTIGNLSAGTYSNITVTIQGCISNIAGPITITDPSAPVVTIGSNSAICAGQTLNLTSTSSLNNSTFVWTGPNNFNSNVQNPSLPLATVAATGTYTLVVSAGSCSTTMTTAVTVNASPVTPIAGVNNPICQGNSINLTATTTTTGVTYDWTGPGGYTAPNTQNPTIANATTADNGVYTVVASANGCPSIAATVNVNVTATPAIQFTSSNPTACGTNTGSITLNGVINGSSYIINYSKNGTPQTAITQTANGGTVTIGNLGAGTYSNITVSLNGCPSNIVGPVTLSDPTQPPTPVANSNSPICEGDALNLTAGNIGNAQFSWTGPNTFTSGVQNPTIASATVAATGTYTVVAVVNGCTSAPGTVNVVVNPIPAQPVITANTPLCEGSTLNMGANTIQGVTYSWSGPNAFTSNNQGETINNVQPAMNGIYTVVVDNGTCTNTESVTITVNPTPGAPTVVTPLELCQFEQVQLTAQGQNLLWYTQPTGGTGSPTVTPPSNFASTMSYYVSQTVNGCEGPRTQLDVTVKPQPAVPQAQTNYNYCKDEPVAVLTATGTNIQWYTTQTGGTGDTTTPTLSSAVPGIYHYYVTQTINGCESERLDITLMVNTKPDRPVVEQMTLCQDAPVPPFGVQGQNLLWYNAATGGTGSGSLPQVNTADTGTTDYYVSQTVNGCESDRALIRVTINPRVDAQFSTDKDTLCDSYPLTVTFTGTAPTGATFNWNFNGGNATGTGAGPYTVSWNDQGTKTITLTVSNLNCTSSTSGTVYVLPTPKPVFTLLEDACPGDKVRVQAAWDQMEMPGYVWNFSGADVLSGSGGGPYTLQWNTPGDKVVSLSLTNIPCPSLPYEQTISVHLPEAKITSVSSDDICAADSVLFSANPGLDYSYQWTPQVYFGKGETSKGQSVWGTVRMSGYAWLTVTDRWGCSASDSVLMSTKSCCQVFLPNVFSPNNDGKNDVFRMMTKGHQTIKRFIIVNRWGKIVFDTADQNEGWDGSFNGEPQDIGTYQYYLKYECAEGGELMEMKGDVTLVK
jgi:gliding motility-associated-like protein